MIYANDTGRREASVAQQQSKGNAMALQRRQFLRLVVAAAALPAASRLARAQSYPARPVRVIVGQAAGSSSDITARLIGQFVSERLGQQFVIEVRPGAAGNIATEVAVNAPADGYTILLVNAQNTINSALYDKLNFNFLRDIAPVAGIDRVPLVMEVNPSFPASTVAEFIAYAKANPGKIKMASAGIGGPQHVAGELFKFMAGVDLVHVPYRGSTPALTDLLAGQVQVMFDVTPSSVPHIKAGKLKPLAVTTTTRLDMLPDVPVVADFLPGYEASAWIGFGVPKSTPTAIVDTLNRQFNAAIADPTIKKRLADLGAMAMPPNTPAEFAKHTADDAEKWTKVIKASGIKPE
jgi:tripartite-type tricarboxylate transporter receptor subunit TctC